MFAFGFLPQNFGSRDRQMLFCHSITAGWVVRGTQGGGNTQPLPVVIEFF